MLTLPNAWAWDFWLADDGERFHLFYLHAPRDLGDPELRHRAAGVGHAVSTDLRTWEPLPEALTAGEPGGPDDLAIWTGCVVRPGPDDPWHMFYTGTTDVGGEVVQSTCLATSPDLGTWTREPGNPVLRADPRWYELLGEGWPGEHWRDPWVHRDPGGDGWHMLVTARARTGPDDDRGVVGAAWSLDLRRWQARPPRSAPGAGFGQLEVMQVEVVGDPPAGRPVLLFACLRRSCRPPGRPRSPPGASGRSRRRRTRTPAGRSTSRRPASSSTTGSTSASWCAPATARGCCWPSSTAARTAPSSERSATRCR